MEEYRSSSAPFFKNKNRQNLTLNPSPNRKQSNPKTEYHLYLQELVRKLLSLIKNLLLATMSPHKVGALFTWTKAYFIAFLCPAGFVKRTKVSA